MSILGVDDDLFGFFVNRVVDIAVVWKPHTVSIDEEVFRGKIAELKNWI